MSLFKSKFAKLEAFTSAKEADRTPEMLAEAQAEQDRIGTGVILVPKTDRITDGPSLDKHLETLENSATEARKEAAEAKAEADKATKALEALKGQRVVDGAAGSDKGEGGDELSDADKAEAQNQAVVTSTDSPWNAQAEAMGFTVPAPDATTTTTTEK